MSRTYNQSLNTHLKISEIETKVLSLHFRNR
jgi:hypothetical protein